MSLLFTKKCYNKFRGEFNAGLIPLKQFKSVFGAVLLRQAKAHRQPKTVRWRYEIYGLITRLFRAECLLFIANHGCYMWVMSMALV